MTISRLFAVAAGCLALVGCDRVDDDRIPPAAVHVAFNNVGEWNIYGVAGAGSYRYFIRPELQPPGFPYTALSYTGFGGILLIGDVHGTPVAYDLACPVECKPTVRIQVLPDEMRAQCPQCHSVYEIMTNHGQPISGPAAKHHYGLRKYYVGPGAGGQYMLISR